MMDTQNDGLKKKVAPFNLAIFGIYMILYMIYKFLGRTSLDIFGMPTNIKAHESRNVAILMIVYVDLFL